ncbi:tRNAHis guanylyltransferase [Seiridium cupressi]
MCHPTKPTNLDCRSITPDRGSLQAMANSRFEYVRAFEQTDYLLPNTWIVVRIDGRGFTKLCAKYNFEKPNDRRALDLMNAAAKAVMTELPDITIGYGVSDEFSFVFHKTCTLFERRSSLDLYGILCIFLVDVFSRYAYLVTVAQLRWASSMLPQCPKLARLYELETGHINNLYNTTFWSLIQLGGMSAVEAEKFLAGTVSADKNEILFSRFHINYNNEPEIYKKGSVVLRDYELVEPGSHDIAEVADDIAEPLKQSKTQAENDKKRRAKARVTVEHLDIIKDDFWDRRPWLLSNKPGKVPKQT